jgi:hypothetical protein
MRLKSCEGGSYVRVRYERDIENPQSYNDLVFTWQKVDAPNNCGASIITDLSNHLDGDEMAEMREFIFRSIWLQMLCHRRNHLIVTGSYEETPLLADLVRYFPVWGISDGVFNRKSGNELFVGTANMQQNCNSYEDEEEYE